MLCMQSTKPDEEEAFTVHNTSFFIYDMKRNWNGETHFQFSKALGGRRNHNWNSIIELSFEMCDHPTKTKTKPKNLNYCFSWEGQQFGHFH